MVQSQVEQHHDWVYNVWIQGWKIELLSYIVVVSIISRCQLMMAHFVIVCMENQYDNMLGGAQYSHGNYFNERHN